MMSGAVAFDLGGVSEARAAVGRTGLAPGESKESPKFLFDLDGVGASAAVKVSSLPRLGSLDLRIRFATSHPSSVKAYFLVGLPFSYTKSLSISVFILLHAV